MFYYSLYEFAWLLISISLFSLNDLFVNKFINSNNNKLIYYFLVFSLGAYLLEKNINNSNKKINE